MLGALQQGRFDLIACEPLLTELNEVLQRRRFITKYGIRPADREDIVASLRAHAESCW